MKIIIGSDHGGYKLKTQIQKYLIKLNYKIEDVGCFNEDSCDYPEIAKKVGLKCIKENLLGIVICGTGIGISIAANKIKGIRAALCTNSTHAKLTKTHNNANVLALGGRITGIEVAKDIVKTFLETSFSNDERHIHRVSQIEK